MGNPMMRSVSALCVLALLCVGLGSTDGTSDLDGGVVQLDEEQQALRLMEAGPAVDLQALRQKALTKAEKIRELEQEKARLQAKNAVATAALKPKARPGKSTTPVKQVARGAKQMLQREVAKAKPAANKSKRKMKKKASKLKKKAGKANKQLKK